MEFNYKWEKDLHISELNVNGKRFEKDIKKLWIKWTTFLNEEYTWHIKNEIDKTTKSKTKTKKKNYIKSIKKWLQHKEDLEG